MKKTMGETIASLRKEKGMTQKELAEKMSVTDKAVSKWERDLSCPDINSVPHLADVLGVSVEELMNASSENRREKNQVDKILGTVLKAVPLAQGVAVLALSVLGELTWETAAVCLGIGVACLALDALRNQQ